MKNEEPNEEKCFFIKMGKTSLDESANMRDEEKIGFLVKAYQHHHTLPIFLSVRQAKAISNVCSRNVVCRSWGRAFEPKINNEIYY